MSFLYQRSKFIICLTLLITLCGGYLLTKLPISLYPVIEKPTVRVTLRPSQDVFSFYKEWGEKMERSLKTIEHVTEVETTYKQGLVRFLVHFAWNINPETAKREVATVASFYQAQLPDHESAPIVDFLDPSSENYLAITSDRYDNDQLSRLLLDNLKPQLDAIDGVAASMVSQKNVPYIQVSLKPYKMMEYGISLGEVLNTLLAHQYDYKLGQLNTDQNGKISIKFKKTFQDLEKLSSIKLNSLLGNSVTINDIATVKMATVINHRSFQLDEKSIVAVAVWPKPGSNVYEVSSKFQELVNDFTKDIGEVIVLNNPKRFIEDAIMSIVYALITGILTAAFVVMLFYRKIKSIFLICVAIPIGLAFGLLLMKIMNVGINLLSLGGMSICIGLVVDNVVIILDRLQRQQKEYGRLNTQLTVAAMKQVTPPIVTSTLTSIVVFLPLVFTAPAVSAILKDISLVTITILMASSFLSLFFVPACFMILSSSKKHTSVHKTNPVKKQSKGYLLLRSILVFFERKPILRSGFIMACFATCLYTIWAIMPMLRTEIVAKPKAEIIDVEVAFRQAGLRDEDKQAVLKPIREIFYRELKEQIKYVYTDIRENVVYLSIHLTSYNEFESVYKRLGEIIPESDSADISFSPWVTSALNIKDNPSLMIKFLGQDEARNRQLANIAYNYAKKNKEIVRRSKNKPGNKTTQSLNVELKETVVNSLFSAEKYQNQLEQLQNFIEFSAEPRKLYDVNLASGLTPLKVEVEQAKNNLEQLYAVPLVIDEHKVFLQDLVNFESKKEWREYYSKDGLLRYQVNLWFNKEIDQKAGLEFREELLNHLKQESGLAEIPLVFEDTQLEVSEALDSLKMAFVFSVFAVFLLVLLQFADISKALLVVSVIIFGLTGALLALYGFNSTLSINSLLGILILVGLTVNNSILILDQFLHQAQKVVKVDAIINSLSIRMRSLLVTNLTTIAGMLPLVIGFGPGKDILMPLGISVSFGLLSATILTLLVVPIMLLFFNPQKMAEQEQPELAKA